MIAKQGRGGLMRRSRQSFMSLTSSGSSPPIGGSPASGCRGLKSSDELRQSTNSLFLRDKSSSSSSFLNSSPGVNEGVSWPTTLGSISMQDQHSCEIEPGEIGNKPLAHWFLLFAMALHIPGCVNSVVEILELHYHSFPLLVLLGTLPSLAQARKKGGTSLENSTAKAERSNCSMLFHRASSNTTLLAIEEYYCNAHQSDSFRNTAEKTSPPPVCRRPSTHHASQDEWGHFTDFDEDFALREKDFHFAVSVPSPQLIINLGTLQEAEEEE